MGNGDDGDDCGEDGDDEHMSPTSEAECSDSDSDDSKEHDTPSPGHEKVDDCPYDPERPETWPDSQWKAPDWLLPGPLPDSPAPVAPEHPTEPVSEKEKLQKFWKKYVVKRTNGEEKMEETKEDSDHLDSDTLQLGSDSPLSAPAYSDDESDNSSVKSVVSEAEFTAAMSEDTLRDMRGGLASSSTSMTLHTPDCLKPDWWGYPEVDTPPKVSVARRSTLWQTNIAIGNILSIDGF